ncbi:MAG TPA: hypothetical protein PLI16_05940 [Bacteroidales bacterium]|nr:hypothetical protein [Bacteroidales bacterium]HNZ42450.1 hypothetical protein [Bacteroidales bacterium]HOH84137.1 hypothetical protein [Bacteroidales bacterium]HPB24170.1 hypothetical protein [Bacteroidales bacterium]HPI29578.1 hypothetical protein [Bacteroidales bacterium]
MNKNLLFFVSDLHGKESRYEKLFAAIAAERPGLVLIGGDILPLGILRNILKNAGPVDFVKSYLRPQLEALKKELSDDYPCIGVILGNDDPRSEEASIMELEKSGLWHYIHFRQFQYDDFSICGYSYVPPTPFRLKDWERYDVSRYVDPGCYAPDEGFRTMPVSDDEIQYATMMKDISSLTENLDMGKTIMLFHSPPYDSYLDRAALDGMQVDHVPLDVHVGSIAVQRFIAEKQPFITLHGHIHESSRITGQWKQDFGNTKSFSAAYHGEELALLKIDLNFPENVVRELL